jgi:hypothetical protein
VLPGYSCFTVSLQRLTHHTGSSLRQLPILYSAGPRSGQLERELLQAPSWRAGLLQPGTVDRRPWLIRVKAIFLLALIQR